MLCVVFFILLVASLRTDDDKDVRAERPDKGVKQRHNAHTRSERVVKDANATKARAEGERKRLWDIV